MPSKKTSAPATAPETTEDFPERSDAITISPDQMPGVISAWDFLYHVLGARIQSFDVSPDGVVGQGFTVDGRYNPNQIVTDVNATTHRPPLFPAILWINGVTPDLSNENIDLTQTMVQAFKGSVPKGKNMSPEYARKALTAYKQEAGLPTRGRGRPRSIPLKNEAVLNLTSDALKSLDRAGLEHLEKIAAQALANS